MVRIFRRVFVISVFLNGFSTNMSSARETKIEGDADALAQTFIQEHERTIRPLEREAALAWWNANVSGRDIDFKAKEDAQNRLDAALSDHARFDRLKAIKASQAGRSQVGAADRRPLSASIWKSRLIPNCLKQITAKANSIEKTFNGYRANIKGRMITDSEVRRVLKESRDPAERKAVWEGSKGVGPLVEPDLKALVGLRNQSARKLGFADYHKLQLHLNEQSQEQVLTLFDELDDLTREPFRKLKSEVDAKLAEQNNVSIDELRPGITTIRSSRKRPPFSRRILTLYMQKPTFSNSAATFTRGLDCRSTM